MSGKRNLSDYLHRAAMYDQLACQCKYSNPKLYIHYYLKQMKYLNKAIRLQNRSELSQEPGLVRFLHTSPDSPNVDIYMNGKLAFINLPFGKVSKYLLLNAGKYTIEIYPTGKISDCLLNKKVTVEPGSLYTFATLNLVEKLRLLPYINDADVPKKESKIRFLHLSPDTDAVDIAVKDRDVVFPSVSYKKVTDYLGLTPMTVDLEIRMAGTKNVIVPMPNAQFRPDEIYTIVLLGLSGGSPGFQAVILKD